jgi:hypothetical protein
MPQDQALNGRIERRLPVIVVVRLAQLELPSSDALEWTYTDNVSAHGARVFSKRLWQPGDGITVAPYNEETTYGNVVYCQRMADGRFFIGVKFKDQVEWSIVRRYDGIKISPTAESKSN